ncbi:hypothetical protein N7541_001803 [Penicillium brevicompactum]|uniref:Uncharacterized protein n=1 Tax=Penicillium brevicompactum TaxID=5074 RepID=A0A9W9RX19_PENBR|nr:hypothetical protein N7541_009215 [Penicillium brevicompactum]KAJ5367862.1 hypothetical protein N7541_001803 [Penicillium brevicompactum]
MHCLPSASLRSLFPNWIQKFWISEGEQSREGQEQIISNAASPYTRTEPAAYQLQDTEVKKPRPIDNSSQTKKERVSRVGSFNGNSTNRPRNLSIKSDDSTDHTIIVLPHIPPNIQLIKGKIIDVGARNIGYFDWSSPTFENAALNKVSNISRADGPPEGLSLAPLHSRVH